MPITSIQTEMSVDDLLKREFGELTKARKLELKKALLAANPQIDPAGRLKRGAIVVLPKAAPEKPEKPAAGTKGTLDREISRAVAGYRKELISQLEARETELGETEGTLKEPELQRLVAQTKNGTAMLESAAAATRDARRDVESTRQLLKSDAFAQLEKDLTALLAELP